MQYIVLDMEWNQPWPGSYAAKKKLPSPIHGEIIQIGAVRMLSDQTIADEFQILIAPKYYKKMNRKVSSLTGIKDALLKASGVPFAQAMEHFQKWCGEDCIFLTWGFDDITILKENMTLHGLSSQWVDRWFNAQMIFNAQTDSTSSQKSLQTALEMMGIEPTRPAHDALGDAFHTALICSRLRLSEGIEQYETALRSHENGFHGTEIPGCVGRHVYHGYADKLQALGAMAEEENTCPVCEKKMHAARWISQPGRRYMAMCRCDEHGDYLVRVRLIGEQDGTLRANRLVYSADSEAAKSYAQQLEKAKKAPRRRIPARRRKTESQ